MGVGQIRELARTRTGAHTGLACLTHGVPLLITDCHRHAIVEYLIFEMSIYCSLLMHTHGK